MQGLVCLKDALFDIADVLYIYKHKTDLYSTIVFRDCTVLQTDFPEFDTLETSNSVITVESYRIFCNGIERVLPDGKTHAVVITFKNSKEHLMLSKTVMPNIIATMKKWHEAK